MGGTTSKLDVNNWELADGKLIRGGGDNDDNNGDSSSPCCCCCDDTIDGSQPTTQYGIYYITKRGYNQREFDITDSESNLLYTTRAVPGTIACFDLLGRDALRNEEGGYDNNHILRITVDLARRYWIVYRYRIPAFPGQKPDMVATQKVQSEIESNAAEKQQQQDNNDGDHANNTNTASSTTSTSTPPLLLLYKKCCVTVSWSRYMAVSALFGPPTVEMLMAYNDRKSLSSESEKKDKGISKSNNRTDDDGDAGGYTTDEDSIFLQASKITKEMKARSRDELDDNNIDDNDCNNENDDEKEEQVVKAVSDTKTELIVNQSPSLSELVERQTHSTGMQIDVDDDDEENEEAEDTKKLTSTATSTPTTTVNDTNGGGDEDAISQKTSNSSSSVRIDRIRSSFSRPGMYRDSPSSLPNNTTADEDEEGREGQDIVSSVHSAEESPTRNVKLRSSITTAVSNTTNESPTRNIRNWFKNQSESIRGTSKRYATTGEKMVGDPTTADGYKNNNRQNTTTTTKVPTSDPLEGVIQLDRPLLLCQEIYNRIIGNHQTSLVSKEKVLELLREDMAQHLKDHPSNEDNEKDDYHGEDNTNDLEEDPLMSAEELALTASTDEVLPPPTATESEGATAEDDGGGNNEATTSTPGNGESDSQPTEAEGTDDATEEIQGGEGEDTEEQPLVGYWIWENTLRTHKMKMHVAKNSDLALHVVMAILVNQVRYERNAIAMTV